MKLFTKAFTVCSFSLMATAFASMPQAVTADEITIPVASQGSDKQHLSRPKTGMAGKNVIEQYGEPLAALPAIGEPPISRWEYESFFVFFEYDHVIHSVLKHSRKK